MATDNPGGFSDRPVYEAPSGIKAALPGQVDDMGSRGPSATTVDGAISNAHGQMAELATDPLSDHIGDLIPLPPAH